MVAFADDDGDDMMCGGGGDEEESETRLPSLSGLVLNHHHKNENEGDGDEAEPARIAQSTQLVPIIGASYPTDFIGEEDKEMALARSIVAHALCRSDGDSPAAVLADAVDATLEKVGRMVSVHTEMCSDTDGPFHSMIASFSMASYGGGGVGVAIQFLESGFATSIIGRGRGDYVLIDPHERDPKTGGMPKGLGNGTPIAIHSNMVIPLSQYLLRTYGRTEPVRYRATFLVPKLPKGKEEEDEDDAEDTGGVMPMKIQPATVTPIVAVPAVVTIVQQPPPLPLTTMMMVQDDEEEPSSEGKRKRVQTSAVTVKSESDESDEKKAKTPPPPSNQAAAAATATVAQKKADSVPTVIVKKTPAQAVAKPKSVTTAPIASAATATVVTGTEAKATRSSTAAKTATTATGTSKGKE